MTAVAFPNYTQIPARVPLRVWQGMRFGSIAGAVALAALLIVDEDSGLFVLWELIIPVLPVVFLTAPGVWRNLCPLAASNQTPRLLGMTRGATAPGWLKEYGYVIAIALFVGFVVGRKFGLDDDGPSSALLLLGAMTAAFTGGMLLKGKSGWCSTMCPLLPVQRIYAQTPFKLVANNHCQPCVGCTKNCYDFNPRVAYLADLEEDRHWSGYRRLFVGAFPGLIVAFFEVPESLGAADKIGRMALYLAASVALFFVLETLLKTTVHTVTTLFGATAFSLFYWYAGPAFVDAISGGAAPAAIGWAVRAAAIALAGTWLVRTYRKEALFRERAAAPVSGALSVAGSRTLTSRRAASISDPEVEFTGQDKRVVARPGQTVLELAEAQDLPIEAGCRMGVCGADPVAIVSGMEHLAKVGDDERNTLERLGLAENTRMACCARVKGGPVCVSLTPEEPARPSISQIRDFSFDRSIERVVVIGNGIAGVTAADHVRRRHPLCEIHLITEEPHHLYNRMAISRLVYGRSAMNGLYLNPDKWYEERSITTWLNTHAAAIDLDARTVRLGTGDELGFDRLVLAMGSSAMVPRIDGFGAPGTFVMRNAADAMALRGFVQRVEAKRAVVAGGGLLGLEAAYALSKLGLDVTVLERSDRLLRRQLDDRASRILRGYLEGLGIAIAVSAETADLDANGRLREVGLRDGRRIPADVLLMAAGITPNVDLARAAGLEIGKGVVVDDHMAASVAGVFAAGDVAEHRGRIMGLWPAAVEMAEVAADNTVGGSKTFTGTVPVTALKVVGIDLTSVGRFEAAVGEEEIAFVEDGGQCYRKLVIGEGARIVGAILVGHSTDVAGITAAVREGREIGDHLEALRGGDWSALTAAD